MLGLNETLYSHLDYLEYIIQVRLNRTSILTKLSLNNSCCYQVQTMILNRSWHKISLFTVRATSGPTLCSKEEQSQSYVRFLRAIPVIIRILSRMEIHCEFFQLNPVSISLTTRAAVASFVLHLRGVCLAFYINGHYQPVKDSISIPLLAFSSPRQPNLRFSF